MTPTAPCSPCDPGDSLLLVYVDGVPLARRTAGAEQWYWMKSSWSPSRQDSSLDLMHSVGYTEDDIRRTSGASVTSPHSEAVGALLLARRQAYLNFQASSWHTKVPMLHADAPMGVSPSKRVVLLVASTVPSPWVLVAAHTSLPGLNCTDESRAHDSSFRCVSHWARRLG